MLHIKVSKIDKEWEERYTYDRRGNLSQILSGGAVKNQYLYGALNRMEQATNHSGEMARYTHNGLGYRVGKEVENRLGMQGTTTRSFSKEAVEAGLNPLEQESKDSTSYLQDDLGSPIRESIGLRRGGLLVGI